MDGWMDRGIDGGRGRWKEVGREGWIAYGERAEKGSEQYTARTLNDRVSLHACRNLSRRERTEGCSLSLRRRTLDLTGLVLLLAK